MGKLIRTATVFRIENVLTAWPNSATVRESQGAYLQFLRAARDDACIEVALDDPGGPRHVLHVGDIISESFTAFYVWRAEFVGDDSVAWTDIMVSTNPDFCQVNNPERRPRFNFVNVDALAKLTVGAPLQTVTGAGGDYIFKGDVAVGVSHYGGADKFPLAAGEPLSLTDFYGRISFHRDAEDCNVSVLRVWMVEF